MLDENVKTILAECASLRALVGALIAKHEAILKVLGYKRGDERG